MSEQDRDKKSQSKQKAKERARRYYLKNKERLLQKNKERKQKTDPEIIKGYYAKHATTEKFKETQKKYRGSSKNRERLQSDKYTEWQRLYARDKRKDVSFKLIANTRSRHNYVLRGSQSTTKGLGCNSQDLRLYMESQWMEGMSWDNYGYGKDKWTIDHKLPLSSYEKTETGEWDPDSEYNKQLIHYTNLQPMWFLDNIKKSNKM